MTDRNASQPEPSTLVSSKEELASHASIRSVKVLSVATSDLEGEMARSSARPTAPDTSETEQAEGTQGWVSQTDASGPNPRSSIDQISRENAQGAFLIDNRYRLLGKLGEGGMGSVYRAEHVLSKHAVALKRFHRHLCAGETATSRFLREVRVAQEIDHSALVRVFDAGVDQEGCFYFVMELLAGESLGHRLNQTRPDMLEILDWTIELLEPLAVAHEKGFVHRDLKPDNVFFSRDERGHERIKLLDFGLVRDPNASSATQSGITFGTPEYMSPEQALNAKNTVPASDVWSVGVMLYEMFAGHSPFHGETATEIMVAVIKEAHQPLRLAAPTLPTELIEIVEKCLKKRPNARYDSARDLRNELVGIREQLTKLHRPLGLRPVHATLTDFEHENTSPRSVSQVERDIRSDAPPSAFANNAIAESLISELSQEETIKRPLPRAAAEVHLAPSQDFQSSIPQPEITERIRRANANDEATPRSSKKSFKIAAVVLFTLCFAGGAFVWSTRQKSLETQAQTSAPPIAGASAGAMPDTSATVIPAPDTSATVIPAAANPVPDTSGTVNPGPDTSATVGNARAAALNNSAQERPRRRANPNTGDSVSMLFSDAERSGNIPLMSNLAHSAEEHRRLRAYIAAHPR